MSPKQSDSVMRTTLRGNLLFFNLYESNDKYIF